MTLAAEDLLHVTPEDDRLHPRTEHPYWNESGYFTFAIPERGINGMIYLYHRPNMNLSAGGPALWDTSGEEIYDCLYWDWDTTQPLEPGFDMFDFALQNSFTCRPVELQKTYRFTYDRAGFALDLTWDAIMEPHGMRRIDGKPNPSFTGWWTDEGVGELSTGHFDQAGHVTGTVTFDGQTLEVDSYAMRDHTWGPRRLHPVRLNYPWAVASPQHSFNAPARSRFGPDDDPMIDTVEDVTAGWYTRDGIKANLVTGTSTVTERRADGCPLRQRIEAVDELGRTLSAEGRIANVLKWTAYSDWFDWYGLAQWEFDGVQAYGEFNEYYTFPMHRRLLRAQRSAGTGS